MKIHFKQTFKAPAHGGGDQIVVTRTRVVEMGAMPPRNTTVEFPEGKKVIVPEDANIRVETGIGGAAYYSWESNVYYDIPHGIEGFEPEDRIGLLKEEEPEWDYELPSQEWPYE